MKIVANDEVNIRGFDYYLVGVVNKCDVFINNGFDFDNFYMGKSLRLSPINLCPAFFTPEEYGRALIVKRLLGHTLKDKVIIDLGAGNANILRELIVHKNANYTFINTDITGPWSSEGESLLEVGMSRISKKLNCQVINIEYDFNNDPWPFEPESVDFIVSCMALHHVNQSNKNIILKSIYASLKVNGELIVMDFFTQTNEAPRFTRGGGGPKACKGSGENLGIFCKRAIEIGFVMLDDNGGASLEINKHTNFFILKKTN